MRITTIFWTSIIFASAILIGWSIISIKSASPNPHSYAKAETSRSLNPEIEKISYPEDAVIHKTDSSPQFSATSEQAALTFADSLIEEHNIEHYVILRRQWNGKEKELARWVFLDSQSKIIENDPKEAVNILEANRFKGEEEIDRLVRLAALNVVDDPNRAWKYLSEATLIDPKNPDLRTFKASLNETLNQERAAGSDYIAAVQYDPDNPYRREHLADFYLRKGEYRQALEILEDTMSPPSLDSIWLKTVFWSDLTIPSKRKWKEQDIPQGSLKGFVSYLLNLPPGIYWDQQTFARLPNYQEYLTNRQETFWLQLLSALKNGQEEEALKLLNDNPFHYLSWSPDLEKGLTTLLNYRLSQKNDSDRALSALFPSEGNVGNPQQLLQLLAKLSEISREQLSSAIPYQLRELLVSKIAFAIPFLAAGWSEAAIQLHAIERLPNTFPGWVAESITQAIHQNRDSKTALSFAQDQPSTSSLSLLIAKLALEANEKQIAFNALKEIYTKNDESGQRAALILGRFLMEHDNLTDAKKAILAQPSLANDAAAKEILARIAVEEGDLAKAYTLYLELEKQSLEAKSFLASKAFADGEWKRARELTEALLKEHPNNPTLTDNLKKIVTEEKRANIKLKK